MTQHLPQDVEQLLRETEQILATVHRNQQIRAAILIATIAASILFMRYIIRRWSWIPRKRQRTHFNERF